jgi:hypothetical protein
VQRGDLLLDAGSKLLKFKKGAVFPACPKTPALKYSFWILKALLVKGTTRPDFISQMQFEWGFRLLFPNCSLGKFINSLYRSRGVVDYRTQMDLADNHMKEIRRLVVEV